MEIETYAAVPARRDFPRKKLAESPMEIETGAAARPFRLRRRVRS